jgi:tRNA A-37 threonylcarbamoyl transferase component Bud32/tetratricopeptide (TPR) repeat protein
MEKIGKYKIIDVLGKGAMGIVYKALDPDIDRKVAIKTIRFDLISEESERNELMLRFVREAKAAGKMVHPNIITIFEVGKHEDMTYIVMQYIEGKGLQKLIASNKRFSSPEIVRLMLQLCDALDYAHRHGIVHRDIKPANILLDKDNKPYIVDFGIARVEMSTMTQTGATIGTPSYMSPEQVMGKKIDKRSDIFSLGAILYELITGKRPFQGESITTVIYKIVNEEIPSPFLSQRGLSEDFEPIIHRALAKNPENRYGSCAELATDLQSVSHLPEETMALAGFPESTAEIPRKKKRKVLMALSIASSLIFAGSGGYFLYKKYGNRSSLKEEMGLLLEAVKPVPPRSMEPVLQAIETDMDRLRKSFRLEDYAGAIKFAEKILEKEETNQTASDYLTEARRKLNEGLIASYISEGIQNFERGSYEECRENMMKALKIERGNKEAQKYYSLADTAISRKEIQQIVERQRNAEEKKDLLAFLGDIGSEEISNKKKLDVMQLFNNYDEIQSNVSNLSVTFKDPSRADVNFSHLLVAVEKSTWKRRVLFEGRRTLTLKRREEKWKIVEYR